MHKLVPKCIQNKANGPKTNPKYNQKGSKHYAKSLKLDAQIDTEKMEEY